MSDRKVYENAATMMIVARNAQQLISQIGITARTFPDEIQEHVAVAIIADVMRHMLAHAENRTVMISLFQQALADGIAMSRE